ncbi:MAG: hydrogenase maturation nickel metallochaperone HypA [Nitrospinota bacterium]|nr:hydrogenase maturation nickel metallochaperone HypA [Nitrospinota bacterium]
MHEMSVAMSIVDIAVSQLKESDAARVLKVNVAVGELSGVEASAVEFCYSACARGTAAEGSELVIERVAARAVCPECSCEFHPEHSLAICPQCGDFGGKIVSGEELYVDQISVE